MSRKHTKRRQQPARTYTLMHEMTASPTAPMPEVKRRHQLSRMWQGLRALEIDTSPSTEDWRVCSDAVNLLETLVEMGEVEDASGLLMDAITAMAMAGRRAMRGERLGLSGAGIQAVRAVLEDYAVCLGALSERTMVRCHRLTEIRLQDILAGRRLPHDVEVTAL
jgi:uncharacterized protein YyaL (SSP411 family)